jgi:hypothetical protein
MYPAFHGRILGRQRLPRRRIIQLWKRRGLEGLLCIPRRCGELWLVDNELTVGLARRNNENAGDDDRVKLHPSPAWPAQVSLNVVGA